MAEPRIVPPNAPPIRSILDTRAAANYSAQMAQATYQLAQEYLEQTKEIRKLLEKMVEYAEREVALLEDIQVNVDEERMARLRSTGIPCPSPARLKGK